ncbi:hypothetical protein TNCV_4444301 [Trichonephila clavipes]|nr:hypothetical protein TNCV_4444301 [Trichonephila clavipes]
MSEKSPITIDGLGSITLDGRTHRYVFERDAVTAEQSKPANSEASSGIASAPKLGPHILKQMHPNTRSFWAKFRRGGFSDGAGNPVPKESPTSFFLKSALVDYALI